MVDTISVPPVLAGAVNEMSPEPEAAKPIAVLELLQLKVSPVVLAIKSTNISSSGQKLRLLTDPITGVAFSVIVNSLSGPVQPDAVGERTMVETISTPVLLTAPVKDIFPVPLVARPIAGLEFVQL